MKKFYLLAITSLLLTLFLSGCFQQPTTAVYVLSDELIPIKQPAFFDIKIKNSVVDENGNKNTSIEHVLKDSIINRLKYHKIYINDSQTIQHKYIIVADIISYNPNDIGSEIMGSNFVPVFKSTININVSIYDFKEYYDNKDIKIALFREYNEVNSGLFSNASRIVVDHVGSKIVDTIYNTFIKE